MAFRKNNIDGALLAELTMQTLKVDSLPSPFFCFKNLISLSQYLTKNEKQTEMGISSLGHRQKVLKAIAQADQGLGEGEREVISENFSYRFFYT